MNTRNEKPPAGTEGFGNAKQADGTLALLAEDSKGQAHSIQRRHDELRALLQPLVDRMSTSHCWRKGPDGPRHIDEPFDAARLNEHLFGGAAYGLSPIEPGESVTRTACIDLDDHDRTQTTEHMVSEAELIAAALAMDGYAVHTFRSSGGAGIHLLLIWDEPQDAFSVREALRQALESCGYTIGTKGGVAAQVAEIFPKQNEVPAGGAGSMWILPFGAGRGRPIGEFTGWTSSPNVRVCERPAPREHVTAAAPELARLKSALDAIPNSGEQELPYDAWRDIVFAVHHATEGSDEGLALVQEFSARSSSHDADFTERRVWPYVTSERSGALITERRLFNAAAAYGWQDPALLDAFQVIEGAESAPAPTRPAFVSETDFASGPPPAWLIKGVLPDAQIGAIYGESTSGKSFFALDMLTTIARQEPYWRGHKVKPGVRCGYIVAEGSDDFKTRIKAQHAHRGPPAPGCAIAMLDDAPKLTDRRAVDDLIARIATWGKIDLLVIDTLASVTPGANENDAGEMGQLIEHCKVLRRATGAMVLLLHHPGKDATKGMRGSSTLFAGFDVVIEISQAEDDRVATVRKLKGGQQGARYGFRLQAVPVGMDDDGDIVHSCVVTPTTARGPKREPKGANEKAVWQASRDLQPIAAGEHPTANEVIEEALRHTLEPKKGTRDNRRANLMRALTSIAESGKVVLNDGRVLLPAAEE
jgi:hypothetical protein